MARSSRLWKLLASLFVLAQVCGMHVAAQQATEETRSGNAEAVTATQANRLQGRAYVDRRTDVVGATVIVSPMDDPSTVYLTSSDAKGVFRVGGLADGAYRVRIERDGLRTVVKDNVTVRFPFRAVVELPMHPVEEDPAVPASAERSPAVSPGTLSLRGRVSDAELGPVNEVLIRLVRADGAADPRTVTSGADGSFAVDDLPRGPWGLRIRGVGMLPLRTTLDLQQDTRFDVTLVRQPASYEPSPLELMPPEEPVPPPVFTAGSDAGAERGSTDGVAARKSD